MVAENNEPMLVEAIQGILKANDEFRAGMPDDWESDPLQDACDTARFLLVRMGVALCTCGHCGATGQTPPPAERCSPTASSPADSTPSRRLPE